MGAARAHAEVVQRLKDKANPVVVASYGATGVRRAIVAADRTPVWLDDACALGLVHQREVLDLDIELTAPGQRMPLTRVVCVPCNGIERWYLTTLPRAIFTAHDVAEIYRVRWEVELYCRHWRGATRLDDVRRLKNPVALEVAVLASLLASMLSHEVHDALTRRRGPYRAAARRRRGGVFPLNCRRPKRAIRSPRPRRRRPRTPHSRQRLARPPEPPRRH